MCNLYSNRTAQEEMRRLFAVAAERDRLGNHPPQPSIFPDQTAAVVRVDRESQRELRPMRWGFPKVKSSYVTNARNVSGSYWRYWMERTAFRCLVPATAFSEYHPSEKYDGRKAAAWFALDEDRTPFAFAGLWRPWSGERKKGEHGEFELFTFLTTDANAVVKPIHPQSMPVLLGPEDFETWLSAPTQDALQLQRPWPDDRLEIVNVGPPEDPA